MNTKNIRRAITYAPSGFRDDDGVWYAHNIKDEAEKELNKLEEAVKWLQVIILEHVGTDAGNVDPRGYEDIFGQNPND